MIITAGDTIDHYGVLQRPHVVGVQVYATVKNTVTNTIIVNGIAQAVTNDNGNTGITLDIDTTGWLPENTHELELRIEYPNGARRTADNTIRIDVKKPLAATCSVE